MKTYLGRGGYVTELAMLWLKKKSQSILMLNNQSSMPEIIVGEAKTSTTQMESQVEKYLKTGLFDTAYELHPTKNLPSNDRFGLINIDSQYNIVASSPACEEYFSDKPAQNNYKAWLINYLKVFLFINMSEDEMSNFMQSKSKTYGVDDITDFINNLDIGELIERMISYGIIK